MPDENPTGTPEPTSDADRTAPETAGTASTPTPATDEPTPAPAPTGPPTPGYPPLAGYPTEPGYAPQRGYPPQPGYAAQPGYLAEPGYGVYPGMVVNVGAANGFPVRQRDPLVTQPGEGVGGWFNRLFQALGTHLRAMYLIGLFTFAVPTAVFGVLVAAFGPTTTTHTDLETGRQVPDFHFPHAGVASVVALLFVVVNGFLGAVGQGAFVYMLTRRAVGAPAPLGEALSYGLRNGFRLWGWNLLYGLIVGVGFCACIVPGLYFLLAGCMIIPVLLYQRGANPISTSFSLVNKNFGAALGRMILLVLLVLMAEIVLQIPGAVVTVTVSAAAGNIVDVVTGLVGIPLTFAAVLGAVLLFAELRARQHPLSSADLNAVL